MRRLAGGLAAAAMLAASVPAAAQTAEQIDFLVTGVGAKLGCSGVFVSGRTLEAATGDAETLLGPLGGGVDYAVNSEARSIQAARGGITRTAYYRDGLGCTLSIDGSAPAAQADPASDGPAADWVMAERGDAAALSEALDAAFPAAPGVDTRAFIVLHNGQIVAERYAPGFSADTPLLGWSMSKSVVATLIGMLVDDGRLSLDDTFEMPGWAEGDPRRAITLEQLLHMSSGLAFSETYAGADDSTIMLFAQPDMAAYAASRPLEHGPGEAWSYSSGTTLILSRILVETLGGPEATQAFAHERLFGPAGMAGAVMEQDMAGTPVGSSYVYATARDWARFGLLYAQGGEIGGRRVISSTWADYVRQPAPAAADEDYGAQFWLNGWMDGGRSARSFPELPGDTFYASGHNGQTVMIIPSLDVVVVRLGWTTGGARYRLNAVVPPVLRALDLLPATE